METAFELENLKLIAEKQDVEKKFSVKEKAHLHLMDEKQRIDEHRRKMQLRKYEIVENYMKHMVDMAKIGQQNTWNIDLPWIISIINKDKQPTEGGNETNDNYTTSGEEREKNPEDKTHEQQASSTESNENPTQEKESTSVEENTVDSTATTVEDPEKQSENQEPENE